MWKETIGSNQQKNFSVCTINAPNIFILAEIDIAEECGKKWLKEGKEGGTEDIGVNYRGRRRSSERSRSKRRKILLWTVDFWAGARGRNIEVNYQTRGRRGVKVTGEKEASWGFLDKTDDEVWATCFYCWPSCAFPGTRSKLILHKHSLILHQSASKYKRHLSDDFPELNIIKSHLSWAELGSTQKPSCVNSFNLVFSLPLLSVWPEQHTKCEKYTSCLHTVALHCSSSPEAKLHPIYKQWPVGAQHYVHHYPSWRGYSHRQITSNL